jgi:hypothetical protein
VILREMGRVAAWPWEKPIWEGVPVAVTCKSFGGEMEPILCVVCWILGMENLGEATRIYKYK